MRAAAAQATIIREWTDIGIPCFIVRSGRADGPQPRYHATPQRHWQAERNSRALHPNDVRSGRQLAGLPIAFAVCAPDRLSGSMGFFGTSGHNAESQRCMAEELRWR